MNVSLEQAIEIHGRALKHRKGAKVGSAIAAEQAERCKASGDLEGFEVWQRVSALVEQLDEEKAPQVS